MYPMSLRLIYNETGLNLGVSMRLAGIGIGIGIGTSAPFDPMTLFSSLSCRAWNLLCPDHKIRSLIICYQAYKAVMTRCISN